MMPADDPVLAEAVRRLVDRLHPLRIVLFGSRAWGSPASQSDYDFLVLVQSEENPRMLETESYKVLSGIPAAFDVIVRSAAWWTEWWDTPHSLERRIETEGVTVHGSH